MKNFFCIFMLIACRNKNHISTSGEKRSVLVKNEIEFHGNNDDINEGKTGSDKQNSDNIFEGSEEVVDQSKIALNTVKPAEPLGSVEPSSITTSTEDKTEENVILSALRKKDKDLFIQELVNLTDFNIFPDQLSEEDSNFILDLLEKKSEYSLYFWDVMYRLDDKILVKIQEICKNKKNSEFLFKKPNNKTIIHVIIEQALLVKEEREKVDLFKSMITSIMSSHEELKIRKYNFETPYIYAEKKFHELAATISSASERSSIHHKNNVPVPGDNNSSVNSPKTGSTNFISKFIRRSKSSTSVKESKEDSSKKNKPKGLRIFRKRVNDSP